MHRHETVFLKLTIGTGGEGGSANGGLTGEGNPTSLTNANTGQLIAGFPGADVRAQRHRAAGSGLGGIAMAGGSSGGSGGGSGPGSDTVAEPGGMLQTAGYSGMPGQGGFESDRFVQAGGGGEASIGTGGTSGSAISSTVAGPGARGDDGRWFARRHYAAVSGQGRWGGRHGAR